MIDNFLEGGRYYQFPSFEVAIYSVLLALVLSSVIAFTYKFTYKGKSFPNNFFQAMILGAIATSMIMMAVGDNIAVGFSIIGVIAIIRFRIQFQNTRNIIFIFAAISVGVATGAYGYSIAIAGTVIFSLVAILLHSSPYGQDPVNLNRIDFTLGEGQELDEVMSILRGFISNELLLTIRHREVGTRYEYQCLIQKQFTWNEIHLALKGKTIDLRITEVRKEEAM